METKTTLVGFSDASRRSFLKRSMLGAAGVIAFPNLLLPRSAFGAESSPNRRVQVAQIGIGRMGTGDMGGILKHPQARVVAVCDLDSKRLGIAKDLVEKFYKKAGESAVDVKAYHDYHEVLARPDIDAVVVSVPDHWHALVALEAVLAGKDVYCQKPLTYSILEAQLLRAAVLAKDRILQVGSQQRSGASFRSATELVRDGHIGKIKTVQIGLGADKPSGKKPAPQEVPANLDYERWLGPAPQQPYMEGRVHPQNSTGAWPGWITTEDFGLGMITNWGAHHIDIAQWGIGMELSGPNTITAQAEFMHDDLWTVHTGYHIELFVEKLDLIGMLEPVTLKYEVRASCSRGWGDLHSRASLLRRCSASGLPNIIFLFGDHDIGGLSITDSFKSNCEELLPALGMDGLPDMRFIRIGLNRQEIDELGLIWIEGLETSSGKDLAKPSHPQFKTKPVQDYLKTFGARKCEANALLKNPKAAVAIMEKAIQDYVTGEAFKRYHAQIRLDTAEAEEAILPYLVGDDE